MKTTFSKEFLLDNRGCYEKQDIERLWNGGRGETVTIFEILESEISIKDKMWFLRNKAELTIDQKKAFAVIAAWVVLPIFEMKYPDDKRPREALDAIEKFKKGEITREQLSAAAYAAYASASAYASAYAYASAADADAAYAYVSASDASASAYAYASAASASAYAYAASAASAAYAYADDAYAADAASAEKTTYSQRLQIAAIEFVKSCELEPETP